MKNYLIIITMLMIVFNADVKSQLVQSNYQGVTVPQYICSGGTTRLPYVFRATVTGLQPNTNYRYYSQACRYTDFGSTNSGAGNPIFINGTNFRYSTSTSLSTAGAYDSLTTDASGNYSGWFGFVNTGNARFTAGNFIYPSITLDSAGNGSTKYRFALNDSIMVLGFSDSATSTSGTGIYGISDANPKNIITLYDNVNNSGRPLSMVYAENDGIDASVMTSLVQYYTDSVDARNGRFGTVIPNILPNGVRRINVLRLSDGSVANYITDADGVWPSGTNTVNPHGGSANPLRLSQLDVILNIKTGIAGPEKFSLEQNFPNPFNPATAITFSIPAGGNVKLCIYNMLGKEVSTVVDGHYGKGSYNVIFNGENLNSGVYFYSLDFTGENGQNFSDRKKLVLIK